MLLHKRRASLISPNTVLVVSVVGRAEASLGFSLFGCLRIRHKRDNGGGNEKCYGIDQDRPRNSDQSDESTSDR